MPLGTKYLANPPATLRGWVKFEDGRPIRKVGRVGDGFKPANREDLGDLDRTLWKIDRRGNPEDPWKFTYYVPLENIQTCDTALLPSATNSDGGRKGGE